MFNQNETAIAQIVEYIPRACRHMLLKEAKARLEKKIALYTEDGIDAEVLNATFARALNSHTRDTFFANVAAHDFLNRRPADEPKECIHENGY